jgi:glycosyltransferase involved in cell wall biosynthesis
MPFSSIQKIDYPIISRIPEGTHRPFWSVMIPTYNCAEYLVKTLESVLVQDPGSEQMQIEVIDDCSTKDDPEIIVREVGKGRVSFFRHPQNVGPIQNFNKCIERGFGMWIHILHGDDAVKPGFYEKYKELIQQYPGSSLIFSPSHLIDGQGKIFDISNSMVSQDGIVENFSQKQAIRNWILTPSVVIPRKIYEKIGGFNEKLYHTADWEMFFRAGSYKKAISSINSYSLYRDHLSNHTSKLVMTGDNIHQGLLAVKICLENLSIEDRAAVQNQEFLWLSSVAYYYAIKLLDSDFMKGSLIQAGWALRLNPNLSNFKLLLKVFLRYFQNLSNFKSISNTQSDD